MDKNNIKKQLVKRFVNEATPGIDVTKAVLSKSKAFNDEGLKDIEKKLKDADKGQKKSASKTKNMPQNKFNYNGNEELQYHQEMEIMNGQEMIEYDRDPNQMFKDRALEAIEGSARMGNSSEYANVVPEQMGFTGPTFGKKLVKAIKDSYKKRQDAVKGIISFGDDIETVPDNYAPMAKFSALNENIFNTPQMGGVTTSKGTAGYINNTSKQDQEYRDSINKRIPTINYKGIEIKQFGDDLFSFYSDSEGKIKNFTSLDASKDYIDGNNNKTQIKEGMKRLKFKQEFKGVGNALKLIPESYKVDNKVFEMTDGVESYRMRWEGTLNEGKAVVLMASDKTLVNEDMQKMKHLMGYKSQDTLGTVKGKARIDENAIFADIWKKSQILIEGEDIESQKAPEKKTDEKVAQAGEAKKHVEGSVSNDKGTKAPAAKTGSADSLEKVKKQAPEAKKAVQGSVEKKVGIGLGDQSEGEGNWDEINMPQAAEAKKHIHMHEGIQLGENFFAPMDESIYEEDLNEEAIEETMDEEMYESVEEIEETDEMDEMDSLMEAEDEEDEDEDEE